MRTLALGMAIALCFAAGVRAQTSGGTSGISGSIQPNAAQDASGSDARERIQRDLQQSGFTEVQIMPMSFLVRAKDRGGHPVMIIVNPDATTALTNLPAGPSPSGPGANGTVGEVTRSNPSEAEKLSR